MSRQYESLSQQHIDFITQQKLFFVGTAAEQGTVNISPKGGDCFRVLNEHQVAWLNWTGSGNETAAHVLKSPRMTLMFCALDGEPMILRLYGVATPVHRGDWQWKQMIELFPENPSARQIFVLDVQMVQVSCGMTVPRYEYQGERQEQRELCLPRGEDELKQYWLSHNQTSIDGFATEIAQRSGVEEKETQK